VTDLTEWELPEAHSADLVDGPNPPEEIAEWSDPPDATSSWSDRLLSRPFFEPLRDTKVWGILIVRAYLAVIFFQAALGHLGTPASVLANQWAPGGPFAGLGDSVRAHPAPFVDAVIGIELLLALALTIGFATRLSGIVGLLLNAFFFAAYEWGDSGQLYLSWDAGLAILWAVVLITAPGRYLGLAAWWARRHPRGRAWWS
jgi:uncharacterized membrane protein YphA (DoxX/SURF4 family)